jgi:hypothetical protein
MRSAALGANARRATPRRPRAQALVARTRDGLVVARSSRDPAPSGCAPSPPIF